MSTDANKVLVRRVYEEVFTHKDLEVLAEVMISGLVDHDPLPGQRSGREGFKDAFAAVHAAFPDYESVIDDEVAEGDKVVLRYTSRGTHRGELMGIVPSGKEVSFTGIAIWRVTDGKIVERWNEADIMGLMRQLGAVRRPAHSEEANSI